MLRIVRHTSRNGVDAPYTVPRCTSRALQYRCVGKRLRTEHRRPRVRDVSRCVQRNEESNRVSWHPLCRSSRWYVAVPPFIPRDVLNRPYLGNLRFQAPQPPLNMSSMGIQIADTQPAGCPEAGGGTKSTTPFRSNVSRRQNAQPEDCLMLKCVVPFVLDFHDLTVHN